MVSIEDLYRSCTILTDAKDKAGEHLSAYSIIMSGVKSGSSQKRLASQFIARFSRYFPSLGDDSLDALFDLCEDEDINVRKQAVRDLIHLCRNNTEHLDRIVNVLMQLLVALDDTSELSNIHTSLVSMLRTNSAGTLKGVLAQLVEGEDSIKEQAIMFLRSKLKVLLPNDLSYEMEQMIIQSCKELFTEVSDARFLQLIQILKIMPTMEALTGRQFLLEAIAKRINFDVTLEPDDFEQINRAIQLISETVSLFSKNVHSSKFVSYICLQMLPGIATSFGFAVDNNANRDTQLKVLKLLAETTIFCGQMDNVAECMVKVCKMLNFVIELPDSKNECLVLPEVADLPFENMLKVESILLTLQRLGCQCPNFLTLPQNSAIIKDFKMRLQFVSSIIQLFSKKTVGTGSSCISQSDESSELVINNLQTMIKDFFHNPPSCKSNITLSFKATTSIVRTVTSSEKTEMPGEKRKHISPIIYETEAPNKKTKLKSASDQRQNLHTTVTKVPAQQGVEREVNRSIQKGHGRSLNVQNHKKGYRQQNQLSHVGSSQATTKQMPSQATTKQMPSQATTKQMPSQATTKQMPWHRGVQSHGRGTRLKTRQNMGPRLVMSQVHGLRSHFQAQVSDEVTNSRLQLQVRGSSQIRGLQSQGRGTRIKTRQNMGPRLVMSQMQGLRSQFQAQVSDEATNSRLQLQVHGSSQIQDQHAEIGHDFTNYLSGTRTNHNSFSHSLNFSHNVPSLLSLQPKQTIGSGGKQQAGANPVFNSERRVLVMNKNSLHQNEFQDLCNSW